MKRIVLLIVSVAISAAGICAYGQDLKPFYNNGKWGFKNNRDKIAISCKYDGVYNFSENLAAVKSGGKWGFVNEKGKEVIPLKYSEIKNFSDGIAAVQLGINWGYIDKTGAILISFIYDDAWSFYENMPALVRLNDKFGYVNKSGVEIIPVMYTIDEADSKLKQLIAGGGVDGIDDYVAQSDVAINIPVTGTKNGKTFAVIIANEKYQRESQVIFAKNDGEIFRKYCIQTLGLPEKNVHFVANATLNNIRAEINWLSGVADAFKGEVNLIFYYAGHGIPDESSKNASLLPVDGYGSDVTTGYPLDELYQTLGKTSAKNTVVLIDACFSGSQRSGEMMASARGVAIKVSQGAPVGNMVVFSAAQSDETAFPYRDKGHGMFTYFLLKKLQETKGEATLGELGDYITTQVRQQSIVNNSKSQTPTVTPSVTMGDRWKEMRLK